jgi:hypothetical protein
MFGISFVPERILTFQEQFFLLELFTQLWNVKVMDAGCILMD